MIRDTPEKIAIASLVIFAVSIFKYAQDNINLQHGRNEGVTRNRPGARIRPVSR